MPARLCLSQETALGVLAAQSGATMHMCITCPGRLCVRLWATDSEAGAAHNGVSTYWQVHCAPLPCM